MQWWVWLIIAFVVIGLPLKLKVLKGMACKRAQRDKENTEDM